MFKKITVIFLGIMFFGIGLSANTKPISHKNIKTPFNLNRVIEQVTHHPVRKGKEILIKGRVYEAIFKEGKVILRAKDKDPSAEDMIIPVEGIPEIRGDEVVYEYGYGQEVAFEGKRKGIIFRETNPAHQPAQMGEYTGNVARLKEEYNKDGIKSGEFLIDTNVVYMGAQGYQSSPSITFDGTNYLVVWQDERSGSYDIYGAKVSPSGAVLNPAGIPISTASGDQSSPSITFDGTNYLVVWADGRSGSYDIYGARVSTSGVVLDAAGIPISTASGDQYSPSIAFDGTNYLVVWVDYRSSLYYSDIYGARVTTSGAVLDTAGIPISTASGDQYSPSIAFDGTNYFVVWTDGRDVWDIYGARVTTSGAVLDTAGIPISTESDNQYSPSIAFDGTNYLVVWMDERSGLYSDIYGAKVSPSGTVLDTAGIPISTASGDQYSPSIAFDGTNYLVVWRDYRSDSDYDIYGARVTTAGTVLDPAGIPISTASGDQYSPSIGFDGTNYLVVWEDYRSGTSWDSDIYGARVSTSGTVLDTAGIRISTVLVAYGQYSPSITFDGTNYLVVWEDGRNSSFYSDIYGARVTTSGAVLDTAGIPISTASGDQYSPSIAFDGTNYLVVWRDARSGVDIYGARVSTSGAVLDTAGIPISTASGWQESPSIGFDGTNYLVVWEDKRSDSDYDIYGAKVSPSGTVLDTAGIPISTASGDQYSPSIAFDGTNYLVVWRDYRSDSDYDIYGARVTTSGTVLDPSGIAISTAANNQYSPSIAFDGTNYLVVWADERSGWYDIYGARISILGTVLDTAGIPISTAANNQYSPSSIAFDGTNYFVVWKEWHSGSDYDIYGARVTTSGTVIDSFPISTQSGDQKSPALAKGSGTQMLVVYSGWVDSINGKPANTMRIWGKFSPFTGIKEKNEKSKLQNAKLLTYPNPFTQTMEIKYRLTDESPQMTAIKIYDISGRLVKTLLNKEQKSGYYTLTWDGRDNTGKKLPSGIYLIHLEAGKYTATRKISLIK